MSLGIARHGYNAANLISTNNIRQKIKSMNIGLFLLPQSPPLLLLLLILIQFNSIQFFIIYVPSQQPQGQ
jgi:hypothetical protein